ncbi:MAG TPA: type VI secretion system-associated protein TagF [Noviherbaspirillum sp.]
MSRTATQTSIAYFGKIPSRGDFVKASDNTALISILDEWLAQTMELLASEPRWKLLYDAVPPMHFSFIGPRRRHAIAGHMIASCDKAQRRFPFLLMSAMEIEAPPAFMAKSPVALLRLWNRLEALSGDVVRAEDPGSALQAVSAASVNLELGTPAYDAALADFLELQSVGALEAMLAQAGFAGTVRQLVLALGLLLQPVLSSGSSRLEKSLVLPLPADPMYRFLVATFWMHLITPFLVRADFEIAVFLTQIQERPSMVVGFSGASARTLQAVMDPQVGLTHHIAFDEAQWVEAQVEAEYGLGKLSSYLAQPQLSLKLAYESFREVFIGA